MATNYTSSSNPRAEKMGDEQADGMRRMIYLILVRVP